MGENETQEEEEEQNDDETRVDEAEEADPVEIKIRVLFALLANNQGFVELVEICEAFAESDEADELLMGTNPKWKFPDFDTLNSENELKEMILRFSYDGALPVDRKLLKPLFNIEALRSANGINATIPRLHGHLDLGHVLSDVAMAAASNSELPGGIHAQLEKVSGINIGG